MSVAAKMKKIAKAWKSAEAREQSFNPIPDANYQTAIEEALIEESRNSGRLQVKWTLKIHDGDFEGRKLWKYDGIEEASSIEWFKGSLSNIGVELPEDITELPEILENLVGSVIEITVKTKDDFQNIYFNELLDSDGLEFNEEESDEDDEDSDEEFEDEDIDEEEEEDEDDEDEEEEEEEEPVRPVKKKAPANKARAKKATAKKAVRRK